MSNVVRFPHSADRHAAEAARLKSIFPRHILDELPFVGPEGAPDGRTDLPRRNYWVDKPTERGRDDFQRGNSYARMTIAAMQKQAEDYGGHKLALTISAFDLQHIIGAMIQDGIKRYRNGGRLSRTPVTSTMAGFLFEIARYVAGIRDVQS